MLKGHLNVDTILRGSLPNEGACFLVFGRLASTEDIPPPSLTVEEFKAQLVRFFKVKDPLLLDTLTFMYSDSAHVRIHIFSLWLSFDYTYFFIECLVAYHHSSLNYNDDDDDHDDDSLFL